MATFIFRRGNPREMTTTYISQEDKALLKALPQEKLLEVMMFNNRNTWRVDGLYFLGIEKALGTENAARIDAEVWNAMGSLEARALKEILDLQDNNMSAVMEALHYTSWALDQQQKEITMKGDTGILKILSCKTQLTRLKKGLPEFPCKQVRHGYLINFAGEINPEIQCTCAVCPPDPHSENVWCEWHFVLK